MPELKLPKERRQHRRAAFDRLVRFETRWGVLTASVPELSETGLMLDETPWLPPIDTEVAVDLQLADRNGKVNQCLLRGRVVHQHGEDRVGVAFTNMLPRHMLQLRDYVYRSEPYLG